MTQPAFKPLFLEILCQARIRQNDFFQQLAPSELEAVGTPDLWSAKDHLAHMTFWRQRLVLRLQAIVEGQPQPEEDNFEELNPLIFEEQRYQPWSRLLSASDHAYAELVTIASYLSEEDLTVPQRFDWVGSGMPLYTSFMGNCYEHTQVHLAQYLHDRNESQRALEIYETWANTIIEAEVPETLKGYMLYNLACYYATHSRLEQAKPTLEQAFTLYPTTREFALTDPDLVALRPTVTD